MNKVPHGAIRAPRFEITYRVAIEQVENISKKPNANDKLVVLGQTQNLSRSGLCLIFAEGDGKKGQPQLGKLYKLRLLLADEVEIFDEKLESNLAIKMRGMIVWKKDNRYGFHILSISERDNELYQNLINGYEVMADFRPALGDIQKKAA